MADLETLADVRALVEAFYDGIEADPVLGRFFVGLDMSAHVPRIVAFWHTVAFQSGAYRGRPFDPHARMPGLDREHFARWVERFHRTVDAHVEGPRADLVKARAEQVAGVWQVKLGLWAVGGPRPGV